MMKTPKLYLHHMTSILKLYDVQNLKLKKFLRTKSQGVSNDFTAEAQI